MINKKQQKFYDYLFLDTEVLFDKTKEFFKNEMRKMKKKEREYESIWKFINNFKVNDSFSEEFKISLAVVFIIVSAVWINNRNAIPVAHSDSNLEMSNAQVKEPANTEGMEVDVNVKDIKAVNEYKLESSKEVCEKSKEKKVSSELCGEDDKEMIDKLEEEKKAREDRVREINSKPRVVKLSCQESNYGHPSRSDTKGKHMDEDCCPDPDEWPKPGCVYDAKGYGIMMSGPR